MPTPSEGRALLFVAAVAALGLGVRGCRAIDRDRAPASDREALAAQIAAVDSAIAAGGRTRARRADEPPRESAASSVRISAGAVSRASSDPPTPLAPIDVDRATAEELDALPGIGPALAARIVADRDEHGPFGSMRALEEVRGIGPALAAKLAPLVTFSAPPRAPREKPSPRSRSHP